MRWRFTLSIYTYISFKSTEEGAETIIYALLSNRMEGIGGKYLEDCEICRSSLYSYKYFYQKELWEKTWNLLTDWIDSNDFKKLIF